MHLLSNAISQMNSIPPVPLRPSLDDTPSDPVTSQYVHEYRAMFKDRLYDAMESTIYMSGMSALDHDCYGYFPIPYVPNTVHSPIHIMYGYLLNSNYNTNILVGLPSLWLRRHWTHCAIRTYVHWYVHWNMWISTCKVLYVYVFFDE